MAEISTSRLRDVLARTIGPTPWYWKTFPRVDSASGRRFAWTHHGSDDPAFALYVFYLQAGLVEVLPQRWFTASQYQVGKQWITRAARDPDSHRIFGECFGAGSFLLEDDGCRLERWIDRSA